MFDPVNKQVVISRDVIIDELKEWDWTENVKKDSVGILLEEPETQVERDVRQEEVRDQPSTSTSRPQRTRHMPARLQDCVITSDDVVDDEGELCNTPNLPGNYNKNQSIKTSNNYWDITFST